VLEISRLNRRFGAREAVRSLDLELKPGDRAVLWGPNGAGKSTVLRCVAGTLAPSGGTVTVGGHRATSVAGRAHVGSALALERSFYLRLTGRDNLILFAGLRGTGRKAAARQIDALVEELEIGEIAARRCDECSTGMLQQLVFARALVGDPPVVALDEPTRSLDVDATGRLWAALDRRPQLALLIATHRDSDADRCQVRIELPS
jgi:ABC-type multidrug transport system ATPase subunit